MVPHRCPPPSPLRHSQIDSERFRVSVPTVDSSVAPCGCEPPVRVRGGALVEEPRSFCR